MKLKLRIDSLFRWRIVLSKFFVSTPASLFGVVSIGWTIKSSSSNRCDPSALGVDRRVYQEGTRIARSPATGETIAKVQGADTAAIGKAIDDAALAFKTWRLVPAPRRGELVRLLGEELRAAKEDLGRLVMIEAGKIASEGRGEVQEMIDICDFAVGLSRQLYGLTIASERPAHRMMEQWHPLGPIGVITTFNFPVAVWAWNAALAFACGDTVIWKPSEKTPLTALAFRRW